jgi:hypothetical protein
MNCQGNVNSTLPTQLPHTFSYIVAILGHNHFESPNICLALSEIIDNNLNLPREGKLSIQEIQND